MNVIALIVVALGAVCFLWEAHRLTVGQPRPVYLIPLGLFLFAVGFILTFVLQTPWGHVVIR
jgi:hypothetical protein